MEICQLNVAAGAAVRHSPRRLLTSSSCGFHFAICNLQFSFCNCRLHRAFRYRKSLDARDSLFSLRFQSTPQNVRGRVRVFLHNFGKFVAERGPAAAEPLQPPRDCNLGRLVRLGLGRRRGMGMGCRCRLRRPRGARSDDRNTIRLDQPQARASPASSRRSRQPEQRLRREPGGEMSGGLMSGRLVTLTSSAGSGTGPLPAWATGWRRSAGSSPTPRCESAPGPRRRGPWPPGRWLHFAAARRPRNSCWGCRQNRGPLGRQAGGLLLDLLRARQVGRCVTVL